MASYGLIRVKSNEEINKEEAAKTEADNRDISEYESQLAAHISKAWELNRWAKEVWMDEMLECMRQRNGEYDNETLTAIRSQGGSEIYMMLTATKIRAAVSWIRDILLPSGDKAWGLSPTPMPDLPEELIGAISDRIAQTLPEQPPEQGYDAYITQRAAKMRDEIMKSLKEIADDSAERMENKIEDQLTEGNWEESMGEFIEDFCTFPAAIMKGPIPRKKTRLKWGPGGQPIVSQEVILEYKRVSPFDVYPAPHASDVNDGDFIERIRFSRREIHNLIGMKGYNDDALRAVLEEYGRGGLRDWLWRDYERARVEGKDKYWMRQSDGTIDGLHYFGSAIGLSLLEWGVNPDQIPDPLAEYEIDAIKIGRHVVRAVLNRDPLRRRGYHKACFQKIPGGFWGISIPKLMRDHQRMCNATARALSNNLGIASGPMIEVEANRLADGEVVEQLYPWKIIQTKSDVSGRGREAVRFFQPKSNANELLAVYEQFERRADDATSIPRYAYGNERVGGAGNTASGLSMLMNNASKGIKLAISSIDTGVIQPVIEQTFTFNMLYDPDITIKGDVQIVARGATAMLTREQAQMRRAEFLNMTNNPIDMQIIGSEGRIEILRAAADLLDLNVDKIVPDQDEFARRQQEQAQQSQKEPPEVIAAKLKAQTDKDRLAQEEANFQKKLQAEMQAEKEKTAIKERYDMAKLSREYEYKRQLMEEQARTDELQADIQREAEQRKRELEIEKIRAQTESKTNAGETETEKAPIINLYIDAQNGTVKKEQVDMNSGET